MSGDEVSMAARRLVDKVALVIGGGQLRGQDTGNGRAVAQTFARHGAHVAVVDRDRDSAQATVDLIVGEGGDAFAVQADVTSERDTLNAVAECSRRYGRIDVLHNNVGVSAAAGDAPIAELDIGAFDRIMATNLRGMVLACRHTLPIMRAQRSGVVLTISSIAATINYPYASYRISKSGVIALTKHVAITHASYGIRANTILPGLVNTPMAIEPRISQGQPREEVLAARRARIPLSEVVGTAWDVANAALFLASEEASFITGTELVVDGGQSLLVG
jgi:NAD(P)-dependent dehydrogenase (short-subunit alcohol dehydrogenase family)